jgi:hypothetical protein
MIPPTRNFHPVMKETHICLGDGLRSTSSVSNGCGQCGVHGAFFFGYEVVVPVECVAATSPQAHATSLYDIDTPYGTVAPLA